VEIIWSQNKEIGGHTEDRITKEMEWDFRVTDNWEEIREGV
jgi:hypothetical protein